MIEEFTPQPEPPVVRNELIDELANEHKYEVCTWPQYYPDELCMRMLRVNTNHTVIMFVVMMKGITPIMTIGDHKAFIADLKFTSQSQPSFQNPSYNSTMQAEKHLRDQRDSV